jgi:hypothetical protein
MTITVQHQGNAVEANCSEELAGLLADIGDAGRGHFAFVKGHVSGEAGKKGCIVPEISDRCFMQRPHYGRYKARIAAAVAMLDVFDVARAMRTNQYNKVKAYCAAESIEITAFFDAQRAVVLSRLDSNDPTTAGQRTGQSVNFATFGGWRVHLKTKKVDKVMRPVTDDDGRMTVTSVRLPFFQIRKSHDRDGLRKGEWREVNSGAEVIMRDAITRSTGITAWKELSLSRRNFESIHLSGMEIAGFVEDATMAEIDVAMGELLVDIGALPDSPSATLRKEAEEDTAQAELDAATATVTA